MTCHDGEVGTETTKYTRKLGVSQREIEIAPCRSVLILTQQVKEDHTKEVAFEMPFEG